MSEKSFRAVLALTASSMALLCAAPHAVAADITGAGAEGSEVASVIVTAEHSRAAENAPSKASLAETQPESIISRKFIEQATSETGNWVSVANIAPSVSGISANGGGVGETTKLTLRGFQDGQFNITYDGIAFGDTNGPTHHEASYWPASTIGAVVIDRGPGAAGDLGQANFGGAIHFFSADPSENFSFSQKFTYGSFDTKAAVTTLNTGALSQLGGGRLLLNLDFRDSAGELSHSGGSANNGLVKFVLPIGAKASLTLFSSVNQTRFYQSDAGPGETWSQVQAYGKNFALTNTPGTEHYYGYNYQYKSTDFEYADLKGELFPSVTAENQLYTYYYSNKTQSTNAITDLLGTNSASKINHATASLGETSTDLGGYDKLNQYRVWGDIVRFDKHWTFGDLKVGGQAEHSTTDRHNVLEDITAGYAADNKFQPGKTGKSPNLTAATNVKTNENSAYLTWQLFADFDWNVTDNLKISPGFKYIHSTIDVNATNENVSGSGTNNEPLVATNTYSSPLYFFTANYKLTSNWSVYGQVATSFLLPGLPNLYYQAANIQKLQPEKTISYQTGTVFSHGDFTADADVYRIDASNLQVNCTVDNQAATCNAGKARYSGVEGQAAYVLPFGVTVFGNGALISAKQLANAANPGAGIAANAAQELANAPKWTDAFGALYTHGNLQGSVTYKQSGAYVAGYNGSQGIHLPGYDTIDASIAYDFGHFKIKLQGFNLADKRAITAFNGAKLYSTSDTGLYTFQAGRDIQVTLQAKF